ncbi:MAG: hypothetical protein LBT80_01660 [Lactobacillaceae bacterium]|jgi:hypothetical protein|nr:hypothetical protein [Lactobacillaceae bacterium]
MQTFEERLKNNVSITNNDAPQFPGYNLAFDGQQGRFSMGLAGDDFNNAEKITTVTMVVDVTMTRLKYTSGKETLSTSSYVIAGEPSQYYLNVNGIMYKAPSKAMMVQQVPELTIDNLKQETIYLGYLFSRNSQGQPSPELLWYVSRGMNSMVLNNALAKFGQLKAGTFLTLTNAGTTVPSQGYGPIKVLDVALAPMEADRQQGFIDWVTKDNKATQLYNYLTQQQQHVKTLEQTYQQTHMIASPMQQTFQQPYQQPAQPNMGMQPTFQQPMQPSVGMNQTTGGFNQNQATAIQQQATNQPVMETPVAPAVNNQAPFAPQAPVAVQQGFSPADMFLGQQNGAIELSDDDLPF